MTLESVVLGVHIAAVVVAFGVIFAYPIVVPLVRRTDPRALPTVHRAQRVMGQRLISPGLVVVIVAGLYLAGKQRAFGEFWVWWALGAALLIGGIGGAVMAPAERRLSELARRDIDAAEDAGGPTLSAEYEALARRHSIASALLSLLVVVTVLDMTIKPFS